MNIRYLSLIGDPPAGFVGGAIGKRELLSGTVVLLAADCESAYALLPDFRTRVEGVVVTLGSPAIARVGPLLWHIGLSREALFQGGGLLALALEAISLASVAGDQARHARHTEERLHSDHEVRRLDYLRVTEALQNQVGLVTASERKLSAILESVDACIYLKDSRGHYFFANRSACAMWQLEIEDIVGFGDEKIFDAETVAIIKRNDRRVLEEGETIRSEEAITFSGNGKTAVFQSTKLPLRRESGQIYALCGISTDITDRKQAEEDLRASEARLFSILENVDACIYLKDTEGRYLFANRAVRDLWQIEDMADIVGFGDERFFDESTTIKIRHNDKLVLESGETIKTEETNTVASSGKTAIYHSTKLPLRRQDGSVYALCGISTDITAIREHARQLEQLAHYDALTTLPNRTLLADRLQQAMVQALRRQQPLAVAYLDLDGFKAINDNHGHDAGDQLLIALSRRMKNALREGDTLARLGGDEFVVVLLDLPDVADSVQLLTRLLESAAQPEQVGDLVLQVSASLGVTTYPQAEEVDAEQLLRQADQAMYQAKLAGKNRYHIFDAEQDRSARGRHESLEHIRRALLEHEFVLHYQPKVNMRTGMVIGAEALIRWQHPERGLLSPAVFLPVIEDHSLAVEIGEWVIESALIQMERWRDAGLDIPVSVNVGARQLQQPDFVERLCAILAAHPEVSPGDLELEVLETSALVDLARVTGIIESCRKIGVLFALDDFGTGYSSLTYLKHLPVKLLKIDQSFVRDMLEDPDDLAILEGVLGLAVAFRRQVIAEGVETVAHGRMLLQLGCELAQGYGIARPMPALEFPAWARAWRPDPDWSNRPPINRDDLSLLFASVEHRACIVAIVRYLKGECENQLPLDHQLCRFGAWLEAEGQARYGTQSAFRGLESLHRQVHALAANLYELKATGRNPEALARLGELHGMRDALLEHLQALLPDGRK